MLGARTYNENKSYTTAAMEYHFRVPFYKDGQKNNQREGRSAPSCSIKDSIIHV